MKRLFLAFFVLMLTFGAGHAETYQHKHHDKHSHAHHHSRVHPRHSHRHHPQHRHFNDGRPDAWCGWWMRFNNGTNEDPGPKFNLAINWAHWGEPASGPGPGVIGVLPHHVFKVIAVMHDGLVMQVSGNSCAERIVCTHPRGTAGVIAWRKPPPRPPLPIPSPQKLGKTD